MSIYQPGGTGVLVVNQLSHRILRSGDNPTGMGRWSWVHLRGREQFTLRIVTFYRPCYLTGPTTTYQEQIRQLAALEHDINPRNTVTQDLHTVIQEWQNSGDQVILLTNFNDDVTGTPARPNTHLHNRAAQMDLPNYQQAVMSLYEQRNQLPPNAQSALYRQPLETVLALPPSRLQTWTENGYAYFYQQLCAAKRQAALNTLDIRHYFGSTAQPSQDLQPP